MLILASWVVVCVQNGGDDASKPSPEMGEDLARVVAAATEDGEEGVGRGTLQRTV
jgi:hypothetical protein